MKRACLAVISVLVVVACGSDRQFIQTPYTGPTDPTPTTPPAPGPSILSLTIQGPPPAVGPGESAQLKAVARFSDGNERDVTADSTWTSSQIQIATVSAGLVRGVALGRVSIRATYQSRGFSLSIVIKPAGTFILSGNVTEPGPVMVGGATVAVDNGPTVTATSFGSYELFGVAGMVTLRVTKQGYVDQTTTVSVTQDQKLDLQIRPVTTPVTVTGTYRMTLTIPSSCTAVPEDQRTRTYTAAITQSNALVNVQLSDANFVSAAKSKFSGQVSGSTVTFSLGDSYYYSYYGSQVQEILSSTQTLGMWGTITTTSAPASLSGTLAGGFGVRENNRSRSCTANNTSVVFTR